MGAQQQRQRGESDVVSSMIHMTQRIDPDRADNDAPDQIRLR
jgi:hypothetical protein